MAGQIQSRHPTIGYTRHRLRLIGVKGGVWAPQTKVVAQPVARQLRESPFVTSPNNGTLFSVAQTRIVFGKTRRQRMLADKRCYKATGGGGHTEDVTVRSLSCRVAGESRSSHCGKSPSCHEIAGSSAPSTFFSKPPSDW